MTEGSPHQVIAPQVGDVPRRLGEVCRVCGGPASYGFGVRLLQGKSGRWACGRHRVEVERMVS